MAIILVLVYMLVSWRWEKNTKVKLDTLEAKLAAGDPNTRSFGEQLSIIREIAREGKASIPYLFRAKWLRFPYGLGLKLNAGRYFCTNR